jgi:hypothetical protein
MGWFAAAWVVAARQRADFTTPLQAIAVHRTKHRVRRWRDVVGLIEVQGDL